LLDPVALQLGPLAIHWHSVLIAGSILAAALLATLIARYWGEAQVNVWNALPWVIALGLVGARLYHVLAVPPSIGISRWYYLKHPFMVLAIWEGGLDALGALLGGTAGLLVAARRARRRVWRWLDIAAPGAALGQAISRWGNWINQEQYGLPTDAPWGVLIQPEYRLPGYEAYERFQPIFAYESAWTLLVCLALLVLIWRCRDRLIPGLTAGLYFIAYATIRFLLEFLRLDRPTLAGLPVAQIASIGIILLWSGLIYWRIKTHRAAQQPGFK
jgi:phosphatidylglycerol:prolipoprotein diacylglycerol transferase